MPNQNGCVYGLTFLSPINGDKHAMPSHDLQLRYHLAQVDTGAHSPFATAPGTHLCRLVVMDDVIFVGSPAHEEHLHSKYLVFETNTDCNTEDYLANLARHIPAELDAIWGHCLNYPGASNPQEFVRYMKSCQLDTTFFFAAVNDRTVPQTLAALQTQRAVADFIATHQGLPAVQLQQEFLKFVTILDSTPTPPPGSLAPSREVKVGGHNE